MKAPLLIANVAFTDVTGKRVQKQYKDLDVFSLLDFIGCDITLDEESGKVKTYPGMNGVIDISKPINIIIQPE